MMLLMAMVTVMTIARVTRPNSTGQAPNVVWVLVF